MSTKVEKDWITKSGLRAVVLMVLRRSGGGHRCGYVGLEKSHPLWGHAYNQNTEILCRIDERTPVGKRGILSILADPDLDHPSPALFFNVHGSLTYSGSHKRYPIAADGVWWFGFDASHYDDDEEGGRSLEYMMRECESLAGQLASIAALSPHEVKAVVSRAKE